MGLSEREEKIFQYRQDGIRTNRTDSFAQVMIQIVGGRLKFHVILLRFRDRGQENTPRSLGDFLNSGKNTQSGWI